MSVLIPDLKIYTAVYEKSIAYTFSKVCDINYCSTLGRLTENQLQKTILDWLWLNEMTYNRMYNEQDEPYLGQFVEFKPVETINTFQMLKYLDCIDYNIEIETIKTGRDGEQPKIEIPSDKMESYKILCRAIDEIKSAIINEITEYQNAKYATI